MYANAPIDVLEQSNKDEEEQSMLDTLNENQEALAERYDNNS
jgi:hypothetical protein